MYHVILCVTWAMLIDGNLTRFDYLAGNISFVAPCENCITYALYNKFHNILR